MFQAAVLTSCHGKRCGPTQVSLQVSFPPALSQDPLCFTQFWAPTGFHFLPFLLFYNLENFLQFTHHAHQVYLSLSFPGRNRNILIYIITFADRLSNPNPKNKGSTMKKDANSLKMTNKKERYMLTTVHFPIRKKSKIRLYSLQSCQQCFLCFQNTCWSKARRGSQNIISQ